MLPTEAISRLETLAEREQWIIDNSIDAPMMKERAGKMKAAIEMGIKAIRLIEKR